ncbi:DUF2920 family protein [Algisphaera agarilytica]|uniref:DUF2920 family protein n=1 Tax=Algisphaera agarilytica TaxID=1385975 RepID=A0A7X0H6W0_9BACT|nr:DUF2920 family protein [Algisphaera agarilytica]MBB6430162.1 hypothetical protein [Algisphaera agarilytica]
MPTHHVYHCPAPPDVELGLPRAKPLRYDVAWPEARDNNQLPGLLLLIPGFGQDNDDGYLRAFREWVAEQFGMGCVTVSYHGIHNRPQQGAERLFAQDDLIRLAHFCQDHGIAWPQPPEVPDLMQFMGRLDHMHNQRNAQAQAQGQPLQTIILTCGLRSPDGPINLGLPQALDHLAALHDLHQHHPFDPANVIALGSSHGGYLAGLINKLAPNTLRAVFDNSAYAALPLRYVDSRTANAGPDFFENHSPTFRFAYFVASGWSLDPQADNAYHDDARRLRDLAHPAHLDTSYADVSRPAALRCVHAPNDIIAPTDEKQAYVEALQKRGLDATMKIFTQADIDGRYVKSLDHGLGLSLRTFFQTQLETLLPLNPDHRNDAARSTALCFEGDRSSLTIQHTPNGVQAALA